MKRIAQEKQCTSYNPKKVAQGAGT